VQFHRCDAPLSRLHPKIQALILERVVRLDERRAVVDVKKHEGIENNVKDDVVWRRVGRACIPLPQAQLKIDTPEWPVGAFVVCYLNVGFPGWVS